MNFKVLSNSEFFWLTFYKIWNYSNIIFKKLLNTSPMQDLLFPRLTCKLRGAETM